jgi:peptidoglycan/LPS O-acetylase OafA/YrhL
MTSRIPTHGRSRNAALPNSESTPYSPFSMNVKTARAPYIESHAALRGIAALTVLIDHLRAFNFIPQRGILGHLFQIFAWNDLAVFLFFILSGFVMSYVYPSPVQWHHFFVARLARLVPVYEVTLIAKMVLAIFIVEHTPITLFNAAANFLMIQQWLPVADWHSINFPSWSLSVETFLYVFMFPLLICARKQPWSNGLYVLLIIVGTIWGTIFYNDYRPLFFHYWCLPLLCGLCGFGIGFAIHSLMGNGLRYPRIVAASGFTLIAASLFYRVLFPTEMSHGFMALGLILIVAGSIDSTSLPYRILARPAFLYLGDISYSLYLWHFPVILVLIHLRGRVVASVHSALILLGFHIALCILAVGLSFAVATMSYYKLEVPFRRLIRDRFVRAKAGATSA